MLKRDMAVVFLIAFLIRLVLFSMVQAQPIKYYSNSDTYNYERLAVNLLEHGEFSSEGRPPYPPNLYRTPAYPAFLVAIYAVTGRSAWAVIFVQVLLGSLAAGLMPGLARGLRLARAVGLVSGLVVAADPLVVLTTFQLMTETLFLALLVAGMLLLALFLRTRRGAWLVAAALLLACMALVRPIGQYFGIALLPLFFLSTPRAQWSQAWRSALVFLIVNQAVIQAWAFRNYATGHVWTVAAVSDKNLLYYRARAVLAEEWHAPEKAVGLLLRGQMQIKVQTEHLTPAQEIQALNQEAFQIFRRYPLTTLKIHARGLAQVLVSPGLNLICVMLDSGPPVFDSKKNILGCDSQGQEGMLGTTFSMLERMDALERGLAWLEIGTLLFLYLGATLGLWRLWRERSWSVLFFLLMPIAYFALLSAGGESISRFRIPLIPFLASLAGVGLASGRLPLRLGSLFNPEARRASAV